MTALLVPLVHAIAAAALLQTAGPVERLMALAETAPHETLVEEVRLHPEQAREAFHDLLRFSVSEPSAAAARLAAAYAEAWTDPFLLNRYGRFQNRTRAERHEQLVADSLRKAGNIAYVQQGVEPALALWRESLAIHEALADTAGMARSIGNIGAAFFGSGAMDSAGVYYERSREMALRTGDFASVSNALTMLATLSKETGDLAKAGELYLRALEMHERIGALRSVAADRHNLGLMALSMGDFPGARRELEAAIEVSRRTGYRDDEADHLSSLADVLMAEGDYVEAERILQQALELDRETENRLGAAGAHYSLGLLGLARGDYRLALSELSEAESIFADMTRLGDAVSVRKDIARARAATGDLRGGIIEIQQATRAAESAGLSSSVLAGLALASGDLNLILNDYPTARDRFARAERLYRSLGNYPGMAAARHGQAYVHLYQDENEEALLVLKRALRAQQTLGSPRPSALTRLLMADTYVSAGDTTAARAIASDAVDILRALDDPVGEATALVVLGNIEAASGFQALADSLYVLGLSLVETLSAPDIKWRLRVGRAELLRRRGRLDSAAEEYRRAILQIEQSVDPRSLTGQAAGYLADKWEVYSALAGVQRELGEGGAAFETSERLRAQRLLSLLDRGRVSAVPSDGGLVIREQDLRLRIAELTTQLIPEEPLTGTLRGAGAVGLSLADATTALERARREYAGLLAEMADARLAHTDLVRPEIAHWQTVANHLQHDEVFLEYLVSDSAAVVFVIADSGMQAIRLEEYRGVLADLVGFTRGVLAPGSDPAGPLLWKAPLERLFRLLVQPVEEAGWLEGKRHLLISPHGELHYLPFQALISPNGSFLIEQYTVSYAPSASVWVRLVERPRKSSGRGILALAPRVEELPGTRRELEAIEHAYPDRAVTLLGSDATERILRDSAGDFDVIHLATYGVLNQVNPLFSYVELNPAGSDDGRVEVHEIFGMGVDANLVVLSACETGLGSGSLADVPAGDDWVGLTRSFLSAGASNVLATLWRVEDEATASLVARFYNALGSGVPFREALARAQRESLSDPATASPFYWAGFGLVGEGRGTP